MAHINDREDAPRLVIHTGVSGRIFGFRARLVPEGAIDLDRSLEGFEVKLTLYAHGGDGERPLAKVAAEAARNLILEKFDHAVLFERGNDDAREVAQQWANARAGHDKQKAYSLAGPATLERVAAEALFLGNSVTRPMGYDLAKVHLETVDGDYVVAEINYRNGSVVTPPRPTGLAANAAEGLVSGLAADGKKAFEL